MRRWRQNVLDREEKDSVQQQGETVRLRFDFGTGAPHEGYAKVTADSLYGKETGYGFTRTDRVSAKDREEPGPLKRDFCIPLDTAFAADVPDGLYRITLLLGDEIAPSETSVRVGTERRLTLHKQRTGPGQYARVSFAAKTTGGRLILTFEGLTPRINAVEIDAAPATCTMFLAGDSTVTDQPEDGFPYAGWGQMLPMYLKADVAVANYALSGRSSKSFISEGVQDKIWSEIRPSDYLLIQFGHNDQKPDEERHTDPFTTYKATLKTYIDGARERGAIPILVTSVQRRFFEPDGTLRDTHGDYLTAMRELAAEEDVPLVDLAARSKELYEELGPERTKALLMWLAPGEFANFPDGAEDNTHFQQLGGIEIARLVWEGLRDLRLQPLQMYLR